MGKSPQKTRYITSLSFPFSRVKFVRLHNATVNNFLCIKNYIKDNKFLCVIDAHCTIEFLTQFFNLILEIF